MTHQAPSFWQLGWRALWRDLRAGELRLLIVAVALAVGALTAVGFFADRLQGGLQRDARQLIGGDAVVQSDHVPPPQLATQATALGLRFKRRAHCSVLRSRSWLGSAAKATSPALRW